MALALWPPVIRSTEVIHWRSEVGGGGLAVKLYEVMTKLWVWPVAVAPVLASSYRDE